MNILPVVVHIPRPRNWPYAIEVKFTLPRFRWVFRYKDKLTHPFFSFLYKQTEWRQIVSFSSENERKVYIEQLNKMNVTSYHSLRLVNYKRFNDMYIPQILISRYR